MKTTLSSLEVPMKFAVDRMLGKLAKWLRVLGYDTLYSCAVSNDEFLALADDDRILLSRNTSLAGKVSADRFVFVADNDPMKQLVDVAAALDLKPEPERLFTRCTICNTTLTPVDPEDVAGRAPDHVLTTVNRFSECRTCGRIYWPGTHTRRINSEISRLLQLWKNRE